jgi:hypothetical protein
VPESRRDRTKVAHTLVWGNGFFSVCVPSGTGRVALRRAYPTRKGGAIFLASLRDLTIQEVERCGKSDTHQVRPDLRFAPFSNGHAKFSPFLEKKTPCNVLSGAPRSLDN